MKWWPWSSSSDEKEVLEMEDMRRRQIEQPPAGYLHWGGTEGPAVEEIALVMLAKDEEDIVFENLCWHRHLGFRRFVVADNASTDATRERLLAFRDAWPDTELIIVDDPSAAHYQDLKTTGLAKLAASLWESRWIFPVDADEFLCVQGTLRQSIDALTQTPCNAFLLPLLDHRALHGWPSRQEHLSPFYDKLDRHLALTARQNPKVVFRPPELILVDNGNHRVFLRDGVRLGDGLTAGLIYRHFSCRSLEHMTRKVVNGGRALAATTYAKGIGLHWRTWYADYLARGDAAIEAIFDAQRIDAKDAHTFRLDVASALPGAATAPVSEPAANA